MNNIENNNELLYILVEKNDTETLNQLMEYLGNDYIEEEAFNVSGILMYAISVMTIIAGSSVLKQLIKELFDKNKIEIEYHGVKYKGSFENLPNVLEELRKSDKSAEE